MRNASIFPGAIFVLFGTLCIIVSWVFYLNTRRIIEGNRAMAEITDKTTYRRSDSDSHKTYTYYRIKYKFAAENGQVVSSDCTMHKEKWDQLKIGGPVEIAYDRDNPQKEFPAEGRLVAITEGDSGSIVMPILATAFGSMFALIGGVPIYRSLRNRSRLKTKMDTSGH
jgi:hypothetical protein